MLLEPSVIILAAGTGRMRCRTQQGACAVEPNMRSGVKEYEEEEECSAFLKSGFHRKPD